MSCRKISSAAKWNIFLSFGRKAPFGFSMFGTPSVFQTVLALSVSQRLTWRWLSHSFLEALYYYYYYFTANCYEYYYHSYNLTVTAVHMLQILWSWFAGRSGGNYHKSQVKSCHWPFFGGQSPPPETWILAKGAGRHFCCNVLHILLLLGRDVKMSCNWPWF